MHRRPRPARIRLIASSVAIAVATAAASSATAAPQPTMASDPIARAAAFIGMPAGTLATDMANQARTSRGLGVQVAVDRLDAALAVKLTAVAPGTDAGYVLPVRTQLELHRGLRDDLLTQAVTGLQGVLS